MALTKGKAGQKTKGQEKGKPGTNQNDAAKWAAIGVIATAVFGALSAIIASYYGYLQVTTPAKYQATQAAANKPGTNPSTHTYEVEVTAQYPFDDTKVPIETGDTVEIIVKGDDPVWDCGRGPISPHGYVMEKYPNHISSSANACELIGYIGGSGYVNGSEHYIRIGFYTQFVAGETGNLFLGINDAKDNFKGNSGKLTVNVMVTK